MNFTHYKYLILIILSLVLINTVSAQNYCISNIYISGNKHTIGNVILREITVKPKDNISYNTLMKELEISKENLYNTSLFNSVDISFELDTLNINSCLNHNTKTNDSIPVSMDNSTIDNFHLINIIIKVEERWYYWPHFEVVFEDKNMSSWISKLDFERITLGAGLRTPNFLGLGHKLTVSANFFFTKGFDFHYSNIPLDSYRKNFLGFVGEYAMNKTIDITTENNKFISLRSEDLFLEKKIKLGINYTHRESVRERHTLYAEIFHRKIHDTILIKNPNYWGSSKTTRNALWLSYVYSLDQRDYQTYPIKGSYFNFKTGTLFSLNDKFKYAQLSGNYKFYIPISKRWFYSNDVKLGFSFKNRSAYIYDKAIGAENGIMASYELFAIDGQHYATYNSTLKFLLLPRKDFHMRWFRKLSKFSNIHFTIYAKVFFDMGYAYNNNKINDNCYSNTFLCGTGAGIDIVTYYDIVISCGYVINKSGLHSFMFGLKTPLI